MKIINSNRIVDYKKQISKKYTKVFVIIDNNLSPYFIYFKEFILIKIDATEKNKDLSLIEKIYSQLLSCGADRYSLIIGVGGGITTDIAGYVAATYLRGIDCGYIPTSLLAQCDASIGGKNGVNFNGYKNIIGTIRPPKWIFISPNFLTTLPQNIIREGVAEMLKGFIISDAKLYKQCISYFSKPININSKTTLTKIDSLAKKCREYKLEIVKSDPHESGARRLLNFGHTIGHALEKLSAQEKNKEHKLLHGECVAIGMAIATKFSYDIGICSFDTLKNITASLSKLTLPTALPKWAENKKEEIIKIIQKDKKIKGDFIHFILVKKIGEVVVKKMKIKHLNRLIDSL